MRLIVEVEPDGTLTWTTGSWPVANQGITGQRLQDHLCETCRSDFLQALDSVASGTSPHERIEQTQLLGADTHLTATLIPVIESYAVIRVLVVFAQTDSAEADYEASEHDPARLRARRVDKPLRPVSWNALAEDPRPGSPDEPRSVFDLRTLLTALPDLILRLSADGRILDVLPPASRLCPVFRSAVGKHLVDVLTQETAGRFMECLQESIALRTMGVYQYELVAENSASVYEARIVAHASREALAIIRDVTDREVIDQGLNRAERLAAIGTLATSIAHELNNPIGAALLSAETILSLPRSADSSEQVDVCLRNIVESLARCGAIIRHLLNFAKDQPAETQAQEVNSLLCRSCDLTRLYAERAGVQLEVIENADLPLIEASPLDLELVLVNLIHNAVHSRTHGVHVRVGAELREDTILLFVEDNGRGMTSEELSRVLEPFYTTRRHDGGTGLGLHVANRIVREYGGELIFRSVVGQGTRVSVSLPLNRIRASIS